MSKRVTISQADVARVIRACQREGLTVIRIVVRPDGVAIETADGRDAASASPAPDP